MSALFLLLQENQKWYERYPYCLYNIFEPQMPVFSYYGQSFSVQSRKGTVLEICKRYPDHDIAIYFSDPSENGYIRFRAIPDTYRKEFISKFSLKEEPNKNLLLC